MQKANKHDAKKNVKLVAGNADKKPRKPGMWAGKIKIEKDFDTLPYWFMAYFK